MPDFKIPRHVGLGPYPETFEDSEVDCIFPFIFNGTTYTSCALYNVEGLISPVFLCPVRTIKGQYTSDGIPWFTVDDIITIGNL